MCKRYSDQAVTENTVGCLGVGRAKDKTATNNHFKRPKQVEEQAGEMHPVKYFFNFCFSLRDGNEVRGEGQHATKVHAGLELGMLNLPSLATRTPHDMIICNLQCFWESSYS